MEFEVCNPTKRSKIFCSVFGCNSKACRSPQLSFHRFPHPNRRCVLVENERGLKEKVDVLTAWKNALKFGKPVSKTMVVCSLHFKETDYFAHANKVKRKCLKKTAVPSVNLPVTVTQLSPATKHVRRHFTVGEKEAVFNTFKKCGEDFLRYGKVAHMAEVSDRYLCKKWQEALKIGKPISKYMLVCSKHFTKDDFMPAIPETKRKRLKKGVVPSRNIPKATQDLPKNHTFKSN